jgi:hypothetical protein
MELPMALESLRTDGNFRRPRSNSADVPGYSLSRYELNVAAASVADVVFSAGGWLFDRAMAGWDVNVLLPDLKDVRALRILGARGVELDAGLTPLVSEHTAGLAVAADLLRAEPGIRDAVLAIVRCGSTEVTVWGESSPPELGGVVDSVQYQLTAAARVFKGHALAAAGWGDAPVGHVETMFRGGHRPWDSDLVPVG